MLNKDSIEITLQQKFENEKLTRIIQDCSDIEVLRQISQELLKLNQQKTAIANFSTKMAWEAEKSKFRKKI